MQLIPASLRWPHPPKKKKKNTALSLTACTGPEVRGCCYWGCELMGHQHHYSPACRLYSYSSSVSGCSWRLKGSFCFWSHFLSSSHHHHHHHFFFKSLIHQPVLITEMWEHNMFTAESDKDKAMRGKLITLGCKQAKLFGLLSKAESWTRYNLVLTDWRNIKRKIWL